MMGVLLVLSILGLTIPIHGHFACVTKEGTERVYRFTHAKSDLVTDLKHVSVYPPGDDPRVEALDTFQMNCGTNPAGVICLTPSSQMIDNRPRFLLLASDTFESGQVEGHLIFDRNLASARESVKVVCDMSAYMPTDLLGL